MVECKLPKLDVAGSSPVSRLKVIINSGFNFLFTKLKQIKFVFEKIPIRANEKPLPFVIVLL